MATNSETTTIPIERVEISYGAPNFTRLCIPVFTNAEGEFCFERDVPVGHDLTLTAKIGNNRCMREDMGEIERVKWFLGMRWLGLPVSSGVPKRVDFIVPSPIDTNHERIYHFLLFLEENKNAS